MTQSGIEPATCRFKALRYYSDGPGIDPRWCNLGFFSVVPSDKTMCPEVDSTSENEYQGFLLG
jgi:hypothetical protein